MKYTAKFFFSLLAFILAIPAFSQNYCSGDRFSQTAPFDSSSIGIVRGLEYGNAFNPFSGMTESLKLDLYYPLLTADEMTKRPLVLFVHGGAFRSGTRTDFDYFCFEMTRRGYVTATIDYRMGWNCADEDPCANCIADTGSLKNASYMAAQDIIRALHFLSANAETWRIDPESFFLAGASAGSVAVFAAASWSQSDADLFAPGAELMLGPLHDSRLRAYTVRGLAGICGAFPGDSTAISSLRLPLISFHDEFDCLVPYRSGSILGCSCPLFYSCCGPGILHPYLETQNICSENYLVENSSAHCSQPDESTMLRISAFFKKILCEDCANPMQERFSVQVNPVPCHTEAVIDFTDFAHHGGTIHCINPVGQEIFKQVYHEFDSYAILSTEALAPGIYYLVFECREDPPPLKLLVVHP